jgi:hypothetical protein
MFFLEKSISITAAQVSMIKKEDVGDDASLFESFSWW